LRQNKSYRNKEVGIDGAIRYELIFKKPKKALFPNNRKGKSSILNEFCTTSGLTRKHVISIFNGKPLARKDAPIPRKKFYDPEQLLLPFF
jgi:hypothetical protein